MEEYEKKLFKLDHKEQEIVYQFEQNILESPYIGKRLGFNFFREKKFDGKRVLFLVYEEFNVILMLLITDKKAQKHDIDYVRSNFDYYRNILLEKLR